MEERTKLRVALAAAIAANCVTCFEHPHYEAGAAGLSYAFDLNPAISKRLGDICF